MNFVDLENAFKVLGGSFAMGKYLAEKLREDIGEEGNIVKSIKENLKKLCYN